MYFAVGEKFCKIISIYQKYFQISLYLSKKMRYNKQDI